MRPRLMDHLPSSLTIRTESFYTALAYSASLLYSYNSATAFGDVSAYTEKYY